MNQSLLFYYIGGGVVLLMLIVLVVAVLSRRRKKEQGEGDAHYIRALNAMLESDLQRAVQEFYEVVKNDTENIDAYVKLGDILRENGQTDRAIKIHRELLVRRNLDRTAREEVIRSLVKDYMKAGLYDRALEQLNRIFSVEPKNLWAKKTQLAIYEAKGDWENAFKVLKTLSKWEKEKDFRGQMALYKVEDARKKFEQNQEKEGRIRLREALKIDPNCAAAHIALGDSYVREERYTDAIKVWMEFVRKVPKQAHLVFDRLQEVLYSVGNYSEIETLLQEVNQEHPEIPEIAFTLSDIKLRKGELNEAVRLCESILERDPQNEQAVAKLVKLYAKQGDPEKALQFAQELADRSLGETASYACRVCHYVSTEPLWRCPKCGAWNSFRQTAAR